MANMTYIRFENTYNDLTDCYETLCDKDIDELSDSEREYAIRLIRICRNISDDFIDEIQDL